MQNGCIFKNKKVNPDEIVKTKGNSKHIVQ